MPTDMALQSFEYFSEAHRVLDGEIDARAIRVTHETHRGRALANPFVTHRLLQKYVNRFFVF